MTSRRDWLRGAGLAAIASPCPARAAIEDLVAANHVLASQGVFDAYGHVSLRNPANPQRYFLTRLLAAELVRADDILEFDLDGNVVGAAAPTFIEAAVHGETYKARADVNAVIHCHTARLILGGAVTGATLPIAVRRAVRLEMNARGYLAPALR